MSLFASAISEDPINGITRDQFIMGVMIGTVIGFAITTVAISTGGCDSSRMRANMRNSVKHDLRREAVEAGVATWVVVDLEGNTKLKFLNASAEALLGDEMEEKK